MSPMRPGKADNIQPSGLVGKAANAVHTSATSRPACGSKIAGQKVIVFPLSLEMTKIGEALWMAR